MNGNTPALSNISNLPQATNNSGKRLSSSSRRLSMPEKRLSNGKLLNLGQAVTTSTGGAPNAVNSNYSKRNSLAPNMNSEKRRKSSIGFSSQGRKSLVPTNNRLSIYGNGNGIAPQQAQHQIKDSRPLRDKNFQLQLQQDILDFLAYKNAFEIEMKHPLTNKTLRLPTQKDFVLIFQWLYKKIDPGYKFQKGFEQEVYFLLKTIRYPYLETINKSQISAVGGQHWPVFLGVLHWLVQLNMTLIKFDEENQMDDLTSTHNTQEQEPEGEGEEDDDDEDLVDKLYVRYILKSYKAFMNSEDDFSEYEKELHNDFEIANQERLTKIENLQTHIETHLIKELNTSKKKNHIISTAIDKSNALKNDTIKFQDYINKIEHSKKRWSSILTDVKTSIDQQEAQLKTTNEEKQRIYKELNALGFTVGDLDKMFQEREMLTKNMGLCNHKIEQLLKIVKDKESSLYDLYNQLERLVNSFNSTIFKISSAMNLKEQKPDFQVDITSLAMSLLSEEKIGLKPNALIPELEQKNIKDQLLNLKKWVFEKTHHIQDEAIKVQEQLDLLQETLNEQNDELETLQNKLSSCKVAYDKHYEIYTREISDLNIAIEKSQSDLQTEKFKTQESTATVNQRFSSIKLEYESLKKDLDAYRLEIHDKVEKYLHFIITFKMTIVENLEEFENLAIQEYENEANVGVEAGSIKNI